MSSSLESTPRGRRHHLLPPEPAVMGACGIHDLASLRRHLQRAIEIEHSTIPPYLCALYSIQDTQSFAYRTIQSVVMEEMLHMILAANILNAVGGHPAMNTREFVPEYPTFLPYSNDQIVVGLGPFSRAAIDVFLQIEMPAASGAMPEPCHWQTLGQFYLAIKDGLRYVDHLHRAEGGIFKGPASHQMGPAQYYGGGGRLIEVHSLADAVLAIDEIVGQGEGIDGRIEDPDHEMFGEGIEYAHYFKFNEIKHGRLYRPGDDPAKAPTGPEVAVDWEGVYPMQPNPRMRDYPAGGELWGKTREFNRTYMALLESLHAACHGHPERLREGVHLMYALKYKALELMKIPLENGLTAGPSFEFVAD